MHSILYSLLAFAGWCASGVYSQAITPSPTPAPESGSSYTTLSPAELSTNLAQLQSQQVAGFNTLYNETITVSSSFYIPQTVTLIEMNAVCTGCTAFLYTPVTVNSDDIAPFSVGKGKKTKREARPLQKFKARTAAKPQESSQPWVSSKFQNCWRGKCENVTYRKKKKEYKTEGFQAISESAKAQYHSIMKRRGISDEAAGRRLLQFVAYAIEAYEQYEIDSLETQVQSLTTQLNNDISIINAQINAIYQVLNSIELSLQQISQNVYFQVGIAAMNTASTNVQLHALDMKFEQMPGYLAVMAAEYAKTLNLQVPIFFNVSQLPSVGTYLQNGYIYYGVIDDDPSLLGVLSALNATCGYGVYQIARISEGIMPWGYSFFQSIVYAVYPFAPTMLNSSYTICESTGRTNIVNGDCFLSQACTGAQTPPACDPQAKERARRVAFAEIFFEGYTAYSNVVPLAVYNDKQAFLNAYTFETYGFSGQNGAYPEASIPPQCPPGGPTTVIQFPDVATDTNPLAGNSVYTQPFSNSPQNICFNPSFWTAYYENGACPAYASPSVQLDSTAPIFPMNVPNPSFISYPSFFGDIDYGFNGAITFRTLAVSNITVKVNYLVQQQYFFFNSSLGISRSPIFLAEYLTSDGRSVSELLVNQYNAVGLNKPFYYDYETGLAPWAYIPTAVLQISQTPGDPTCYSDACLINRANYAYDEETATYGAPLYSDLIAPTTNPVGCYPAYVCNTVGGPAVDAGITPVLCSPTAATCCNSAGFVCYVSFNGTDSLGSTLFQVINVTIPNFQQAIDNAANPPPPVSYDNVLNSVSLFDNLTAILTEQIPGISLPGNPIGNLGNIIQGAVDAAASAVAGVADAAAAAVAAVYGDFASLFTGIGGALSTFLAYLPYVLFALVLVCVLPMVYKQFKESGLLKKKKPHAFDQEQVESQSFASQPSTSASSSSVVSTAMEKQSLLPAAIASHPVFYRRHN